jgi:hypothetical protein
LRWLSARLRAVAQLGSALDWGSRGRGFKSRQPDGKGAGERLAAAPNWGRDRQLPARLTQRAPRRHDALSTHVGDGSSEGVDDPVGVGVDVVVSSGGTVGDTVGLGVAVGDAEGVAVAVGDGVTPGVGSDDAVPDGELPALGGVPVPDGTSIRAVEERANVSALVDAESTSGTRAGAGRNPTGGATSLGGPELASSASRCMGKGCRALAGGSIWVQALVAGCSGTLSFDGMPTIATIATTAKEPATTAISLASSLSRPISPRCLSVCEDRQFWTVTRL